MAAFLHSQYTKIHGEYVTAIKIHVVILSVFVTVQSSVQEVYTFSRNLLPLCSGYKYVHVFYTLRNFSL